MLDTLYAPVVPVLDDATIVCRCEEVTARRLRATGLEAVGDYCRLLRSPEGEEERARLIEKGFFNQA